MTGGIMSISSLYNNYVAPAFHEVNRYKTVLVSDTLADLKNIRSVKCRRGDSRAEFQIRANVAGGALVTLISSVALKLFAGVVGSNSLNRIGSLGFYAGTTVGMIASVGMLCNLGSTVFGFRNNSFDYGDNDGDESHHVHHHHSSSSSSSFVGHGGGGISMDDDDEDDDNNYSNFNNNNNGNRY